MEHFKAYISGAISGHPIEEVRKKFKEAAIAVSGTNDIGHVYNPCEDVLICKFVGLHELGLMDRDVLWALCMRQCIQELATSDAIFMLPDWKFSRGAKIEHELAVNLKLKIIYL